MFTVRRTDDLYCISIFEETIAIFNPETGLALKREEANVHLCIVA